MLGLPTLGFKQTEGQADRPSEIVRYERDLLSLSLATDHFCKRVY